MKRMLFVCHSPSANTGALRDAARDGIAELDLEGLELTIRAPLDATAEDVTAADGILLGTTENFGYMAGLTKDFFERIYYPCLEQTEGLPAALYIRAGEDGRGTRDSIGRIVTGLRWKYIDDPLILRGKWQEEFLPQVSELAMTLAAGVEAEIY